MQLEEMMQSYVSRHMPLKEVVFQVLREGILQGEFQPGERLMEIHLAERLGVSRTPVRESLHALEKEGLVIVAPRKGAVVAGISEKQMRDVLEVRRALEELAVRLAIPRITPEEVEELKRLDEAFAQSTKGDDVNLVAKVDEEFHYVIIRAARNKELLQMIHEFREKIYLYRAAYLADKVHYPHLVEEHHRIAQLIESGSVEMAATTMYDHIDRQQQTMLKLLQNKAI